MAQPPNQLLLPAPPVTNGAAPPATVNPNMDLLSGDDFSSPKAENSMALVPMGEQQQSAPGPSQERALVLFDMLSDTTNAPNTANTQTANVAGQPSPMDSPFGQQQQNFQTPGAGYYQNGTTPKTGAPQSEQSAYTQGTIPAWNGQLPQQLQPPSPGYGICLNFYS